MMEEEVGIKVTRLRRRLSVESDDVKSPSTQSTPTKKRGGRLAAKPQLELIDENAPEAAPKRTRKSTARDIVEPVEEKAGTPSRRSTRIRSNTSIVSETPGDGAEDKGTPSRRSTRIRSNTSIVAESVQTVNSPRAKRAARRTSQVGSDNETPVTPARTTRRTRKDSTSSIDKQVEPNAGKIGNQANEVIVEESENNDKKSKSFESPINVSPILRKSPRLVGKNGRMSTSLDNDDKENEPQGEKEAICTTTDADKSVAETKNEQINKIEDQTTSESNNLSVASSNLIKELDEVPKKGKNILNKSATVVEEPPIKSKRNRTKSWTTISVEPSHENSFCSDSEASKKRSKNKNNTLNLSNISGSGDGIMNINNKNDETQDQEKMEVSQNSSTLSEKKKKRRHERSIRDDTEFSVLEISLLNKSENLNKSTEKKSNPNQDCKNNKDMTDSINFTDTEKLFQQAPSGLIQSLEIIEDSDSNQGSTQKDIIDKGFDTGDQCVPVVDHHLGEDDSSKEIKNNLSYEPMDIDETMPENISLTTFTDKNISIRQETESEKRKSILNTSQVKNNSINQSKRKYSISNMVSDDNMKESEEVINDGVSVDKDSNKSKRKSSISTIAVSEDTTDGCTSVRKSDNINKKSKRKSSMSNIVTEKNIHEDSNESFKKSSTLDNIAKDESMDKSKINTSVSNMVPISDNNTSKVSNKSKNKSLIADPGTEESTEISFKSKSKSSIAEIVAEENIEKSFKKSKRKSSVSAMVAEVSIDEKILPINNIENNVDTEKSSNKSKSNSLISPMDSQILDKTDNENKSTLVLSQLKDMSEADMNIMNNATKDSNESNEQLSKSVSVSNVTTEKECDKKNISLTYKTSTPLQQKAIKKLGINSSIIAPNSANKVQQKNTVNRSEKETSILSQKADSDSSEEEDENSSFERSKMIDDEAEEASDDYESGDSRDDDEKEYEEQNEIVEKGETLDTEDENELSDDSEYEKGSFIVSSDEEDDDLLSGSGDDLSLSADELSMSAKSKKKYNERKLKEQKKASREMFEARHKNESAESAKSRKPNSKKNNRQRFDSSSSDSDEALTAQPQKNTRRRIDSSDISMVQPDADKSLTRKKKKVKRLSESVCEDNSINEKEITIREETESDKIDPLTLQNIVKEEPKTPQKDLNISTVAVTNIDEVEEVDVDENVSIMKSNQTLAYDPLQATVAESDAEGVDDDSISENEEITQNYESVLSNLNVSNSKKIKSSDISLNLDKKTQKPREPIVDQLNLTQIKNKKKTKADALKNLAGTKKLDKSLNKKGTDKVDMFSEGSSDSIDMKLLFPEDSNDSEVLVVKTNNNSQKQDANLNTPKRDVEDTPEEFIPLKRTEGKTNMLENIEVAQRDESVLNVSNKKKNKRKSSQTEEAVTMSTQDDYVGGFYIDTTGTLNDIENTDVNTSTKSSAKKNKHKSNMSISNIDEAKVDDDSNDAPLEVSYRSEKNKSIQNLNVTQNQDETEEGSAATGGTPSQSAKKKKKNKNHINSSQIVTEISIVKNSDDVPETSLNSSVIKGSAEKKKMSESQVDPEKKNPEHAETIQNASLNSAKKKKQKAISERSVTEEESANKDDKDVINEEVISKKRKRKSSANQTIIEEDIDKDNIKLNISQPFDESLLTKNQKKKRKISNNENEANSHVQESVTVLHNMEKQECEKVSAEINKKKEKVELQEVNAVVEEVTKKNKKRKTREDDDACKISKVLKQNSCDKVHVPRLPVNVINQLGDKPKEIPEIRKPKVISTTLFEVKETKKRGKNPSSYLEESVYLNDDLIDKKKKSSIKYPKTLPSIPNALTSVSGFTTKFSVNPIPQQTQFVAQSYDIPNFKNDYLNKKRIKKLGTFELYKRQRNIKISKF